VQRAGRYTLDFIRASCFCHFCDFEAIKLDLEHTPNRVEMVVGEKNIKLPRRKASLCQFSAK
jgi:hypothetical protein